MADLTQAPKQFRAKAQGAGPVDRKGGKYGAGLIKGVSLAMVGEALGHDMWLDSEFVAGIVPAVNEYQMGMKSRFTHPSMSGDGMGSQLGVFMNATLKDGKPVADLHLMDSAHKAPDGDLAEYVMSLAEESPTTFGVSIVFEPNYEASDKFSAEYSLDGDFISPDTSNANNFPHARLKRLRAADVVDEPAANPDGLFSRGQEIPRAADAALQYALGLSVERPEMMFDVDPDRLKGFVSRFLAQHALTIERVKPMADKTAETTAPVVNADDLRKQFAAQLDKYQKAFGDANGSAWFKAGMDWSESMELHAESLAKQLASKDSEIAGLNAKLASLKTGESEPVSFSEAPTEGEKKPSVHKEGQSLGAMLSKITPASVN
jgi:hypothetical protein